MEPSPQRSSPIATASGDSDAAALRQSRDLRFETVTGTTVALPDLCSYCRFMNPRFLGRVRCRQAQSARAPACALREARTRAIHRNQGTVIVVLSGLSASATLHKDAQPLSIETLGEPRGRDLYGNLNSSCIPIPPAALVWVQRGYPRPPQGFVTAGDCSAHAFREAR